MSTRRRRTRPSALVCLGAGAGVIAGELRHVRGSDVGQRAGGVLVVVSGRRARSVPVLSRYQRPLLEVAAFAGEGLIVGGREPGRRNVTDELSRALSSDSSLPRLEAGRLRSTWLCACAGRIGLGAFMQAVGMTCSQRLGDLAAQLPAASEDELVRLVLDRLLEASVQTVGEPASGSYAIDWTDHETWARPPHGDGARPSPGPEAAFGHRTTNHPAHNELFFGYYLQAVTVVPDEHGPEIPELARRIHLASPQHDPPAHIIPVIARMVRDAVHISDLLADSGYSYRRAETFALPTREPPCEEHSSRDGS